MWIIFLNSSVLSRAAFLWTFSLTVMRILKLNRHLRFHKYCSKGFCSPYFFIQEDERWRKITDVYVVGLGKEWVASHWHRKDRLWMLNVCSVFTRWALGSLEERASLFNLFTSPESDAADPLTFHSGDLMYLPGSPSTLDEQMCLFISMSFSS